MKRITYEHKIFSDISKILGGNVAAQGLVFISVAVIANTLGPERYGVFTTATSFFLILLQLSDLGTSTSYIRHFKSKDVYETDALGTVLLLKVVFAIVISTLVFVFNREIANIVNEQVDYSGIIKLTAILLPFHVIYTTFIAHLQAKEQFGIYSIINLLNGLAKLVVALALGLIFQVLDPYPYFFATYFLAIIFIVPMWRHSKVGIQLSKKFARKILRLGLWIFLSTVAAAVIMQVDVFLLQRLHSSKEAGIFSAALSLAMAIPLITTSISTALLPKVADFLQYGNSKQYMKDVLRYWPLIIIATLFIQVLAPFLIDLVFSENFEDALPVFRVLVIAFMFGVLINPISLVYYYINKAKILSVMNWVQLAVSVVLGLWLIPSFGAIGASCSVLIVRLLGACVVVSYLWHYKENGNT